jgi:hypothetical protein
MYRLFLILSFHFILSYNLLFGQEGKSVDSNHLYIKTDVLSPLLSLITPENDFIAGISFEYKMKHPWSLQLNGNYYQEKYYYSKNGFQLILEGRYFIKSHHFTGVYLKFEQIDYSNYPNNYDTYFNQRFGLGAMYGYRITVNRWLFEARIGLGLNKQAKFSAIFGTGQFDFADSKLMIDNILAFNISYRIF